jgi:serine/threonine-protein kinase
LAKRQPTARAGKKLGRYVIEQELGRGGMGVVYLARDENLGRRVALKTTSVAGLGSVEKTRNQRRQRFIREVQALAQLSHENVVHVYDAGEEDDPDLGWLLFYAMQYVEGITLAQLVQKKGALEPGAAAAVCAQVGLGLGVGHTRGIVHRDVKPANIFLSHDGRALIGDFGIAKVAGSTQITRRDQLVGTPNYLAPEQILGQEVGPATDVFALGALFYVIVTNRPLRTKLDAAALLAAAKGNDAKEKIQAEKSLPAGLRKVVARALEREPKRRWRDGQHFADALSEYATRIPPLTDDLTEDRPLPAAEEKKRKKKKKRSSSSGPMQPGTDNAMSAVEQMAQEMLAEVDETHGKPEPKEKEAAPLPVARTESTVMFNLRAMEKKEEAKRAETEAERKAAEREAAEREAKKKAELEASLRPVVPMERVGEHSDLPVARSESTHMFRMRDVEQQHQQQAADITDPSPLGAEDTLDPVDDASYPHDPTPDPSDLEGFATGDNTEVVAVAQPQLKQVVPENIPKPLPPLDERRIQLLGMSSAGGLVAAIVLLLGMKLALGANQVVLPEPVLEKPKAQVRSETRRAPPEHCGKAGADMGAKRKAKTAVDEAIELANKGKVADARRSLKEALAFDGHSTRAHFELAKLEARSRGNPLQAKRHYECVVALDPDSDLAKRASRAIQAASR